MHRRRFLLSALALLAGPRAVPGPLAVSPAAPPDLSAGTPPAGAPLAPPPSLPNRSLAPGRFVGTLTAAPAEHSWVPDRPTRVWAYNGTVPGPMIEAVAGSTVEILLENRLPQPTNLHWHGLPVPPDQDGAPHAPVPPGGRRAYRFTLPPELAGTFWYHPHPQPYLAEQLFRGLTGLFVVRTSGDPLAFLPEQQLLLTDLKLDPHAQIAPDTLADWVDGREGQFVLINGQYQPRIALPPGGQARWRVLNATSARFLRLALPGGRLTLVGTGGGLLEAPVPGREWLLAPGERIELVASVPVGATLPLVALPYPRGRRAGPEASTPITLAQVLGSSDGQPHALPTGLRALAPLEVPTVAKRVVLSARGGPAQRVQDLRFLFNGRSYAPGRIDLSSRVGEVEQWEVVNDTAMDRVFHLSGNAFQVTERVNHGEVLPEPFLAWRDTVHLRPGERVRFKVRQDQPGLRFFDCAPAEHAALGMTGTLKVNI